MIVTIEKNDQPNSAALKINLARYIEAFYNRHTEPLEYKWAHRELSDEMSGHNGALLWSDLLDQSIEDRLPAERSRIKSAAIVALMMNHFVEIVKNAMDAVIEACINDPKHPCDVRLDLTVDDRIPDMITLQVVDNGGGFPTDFLSSIATRDDRARSHYVDMIGSRKYGAKQNPSLLGGSGKGVRELIANIDHGCVIEGPGYRVLKYDGFQDMGLTFGNTAHGTPPGAVITMTSSTAPLTLIPKEAPTADDNDVLISFHASNLRFKPAPLPLKNKENLALNTPSPAFR